MKSDVKATLMYFLKNRPDHIPTTRLWILECMYYIDYYARLNLKWDITEMYPRCKALEEELQELYMAVGCFRHIKNIKNAALDNNIKENITEKQKETVDQLIIELNKYKTLAELYKFKYIVKDKMTKEKQNDKKIEQKDGAFHK